MYKKMSVWILCLLILVACNVLDHPEYPSTQAYSPIATLTQILATPTKSSVGKANFESLLSRFADECQAPCFLLITPEVTPFEDAEITLTEELNFSCNKLSPPSLPNKVYLNCSLGQYNSYLIVMSNPQTGMVDWLTYSPASSIQSLYVKDIIELFGIPDGSNISALPDDTGLSWVSFYYDALQTAVYLDETNEISKYSEVSITFMGKSEYLEERTSAQQSWEGYMKLP